MSVHPAMEIARQFSFPRRVGTQGEQRARDLAAAYLEQAGYQIERQGFTFVPAGNGLLRLLIGSDLLLTILGLLLRVAFPPGAVLACSLILLLPSLYARLEAPLRAASVRPPFPVWLRWIGGQSSYRTDNIVARLPQALEGEGPTIVLMAHLDTKSQKLPLPVRMGLYGVLFVAAPAFALLNLISLAWPQLEAAGLIWILGWLALMTWAAGLPLLLLQVEDDSPGALDNASGVGMVLHLAQTLAQTGAAHPWEVVITSAEEWGLLGAQAYLDQRPVQQPLWVVNFDGIGGEGRLAWVGQRGPLDAALRTAASQQGVKLGKLPRVGLEYDHLVFETAGIVSGTLAGASRDALQIHTARDTASLLASSGFEQAEKVITALMGVKENRRSNPNPVR